jgi:hypothetical protein
MCIYREYIRRKFVFTGNISVAKGTGYFIRRTEQWQQDGERFSKVQIVVRIFHVGVGLIANFSYSVKQA